MGACRLPWHQRQDLHWLEKDRLDQEQARQSCEQEAGCQRQEGLCQHQGLDCCRPEGQESFGCQGLCRSKEGTSSLHQGQGALPVSNIHAHTESSAQGVGMSTPFECSCFGWYDV